MDSILKKSELNKQRKRSALMDSAYELFTTAGFHKTSILSIALKAGVGKGTFYLYFRDKEAIRDALILQRSRELLSDAVNSLERKRKPMDFADKFIFIIDTIIDRLACDRAMLQFISKNLSWGLFSEVGQTDTEEAFNFHHYIHDLLIKGGISQTKEMELTIFTILELVNSTCYTIILSDTPVSLKDYKPYLYKYIRGLLNDAIGLSTDAD